jgi:CRISPR-associated protein Csx17
MTVTIHVHHLRGCRPRPLGSYLKALGVLRVVTEQADPAARGCWQDEHFVLYTRLDRSALETFFAEQWAPSPFMSPWNKGSGLLGADKKGVDPLAESSAPRFQSIRDGIAAARALTGEMRDAVAAEKAVKDEPKAIKDAKIKARLKEAPEYKQRLAAAGARCKRIKDGLQPECQRRWRGPALRWMRAAVVLNASGEASFPAMVGTGGNDGRLDFTNNALQRLQDLFDVRDPEGRPKDAAVEQLRGALFGETTRAKVDASIGMFAPAEGGGVNASVGFEADSRLNPWDLPLLLEGSLSFTAGTSRRLGAAGSDRTVAPFSTRSSAAGYGSAAPEDESARGEQWLPLWSRPWSAAEVDALLREGRSQVDRRAADSALDLARSIARLGVARGVDAFERYAFMARYGKMFYAVPIGRWEVKPEPTASLLDDLEHEGWWGRLQRAAASDKAPASLSRAVRLASEAAFAAIERGAERARWQHLLVLLAQLEQQLVDSGGFTKKERLGPIPPLRPDWLPALDDGSPELRLAVALAAAEGGPGAPAGLRAHWLPIDGFGRFRTGAGGLVDDVEVVVTGRSAETELIKVVERRLIASAAGAARRLPIRARPGAEARIADLCTLLDGGVDLERALWLARGLAAVRWAAVRPRHLPQGPRMDLSPPQAWAAVRLAHLSGPLPGGRAVPADPAILRALAAGDPSRGVALALRRLHGAGLRAGISFAALAPAVGRRFAASLAFPISDRQAELLVAELDPAALTLGA